jgi:GTPase
MPARPQPRPRAVFVGVQLPTVTDVEHEASLLELGRLVKTLGYDVAATVSQRRDALSSGAVLGEGKLKELAEYTGGTGAVPGYAKETQCKACARFQAASVGEAADIDEVDDFDDLDSAAAEEPVSAASGTLLERSGELASLVVVDHEISPRQARNLERATGAEVLDRTGVIVEIFHRHAQSREARLQVEIARLKYVAPRMRESAGRKERQQGRGAGESALELDRRKIRDRIAELKEELDAIAVQHGNRRHARQTSCVTSRSALEQRTLFTQCIGHMAPDLRLRHQERVGLSDPIGEHGTATRVSENTERRTDCNIESARRCQRGGELKRLGIGRRRA